MECTFRVCYSVGPYEAVCILRDRGMENEGTLAWDTQRISKFCKGMTYTISGLSAAFKAAGTVGNCIAMIVTTSCTSWASNVSKRSRYIMICLA